MAGPALLGDAGDLAGELAELSRSFESAPASKVVRWAVDRFSPHVSLLASMTDAVLIDIAVQVHPSTRGAASGPTVTMRRFRP